MSKLTVRLPDDLEADLDASIGDGEKSEFVRDAIRERLENGQRSGLREVHQRGLEALLTYSNDAGRIEVEVAKSAVAQATQVSKEFVPDLVFNPLRRAGHLRVQHFWSIVYLQVRASTNEPFVSPIPERADRDDVDLDEHADALLAGDYEVEGGSA